MVRSKQLEQANLESHFFHSREDSLSKESGMSGMLATNRPSLVWKAPLWVQEHHEPGRSHEPPWSCSGPVPPTLLGEPSSPNLSTVMQKEAVTSLDICFSCVAYHSWKATDYLGNSNCFIWRNNELKIIQGRFSIGLQCQSSIGNNNWLMLGENLLCILKHILSILMTLLTITVMQKEQTQPGHFIPHCKCLWAIPWLVIFPRFLLNDIRLQSNCALETCIQMLKFKRNSPSNSCFYPTPKFWSSAPSFASRFHFP